MLPKCSDIVVMIATYTLISASFAEEKVKQDWWSWEPLKGIKVPNGEKDNPIDRFIVSKLKQQGIQLCFPGTTQIVRHFSGVSIYKWSPKPADFRL